MTSRNKQLNLKGNCKYIKQKQKHKKANMITVSYKQI